MDLGQLAQDELGQILGGSTTNKTTKKTSKRSVTDSVLGDVVDKADAALKDTLPSGEVTDIAENALDQNKDGHIVDDIVRMGQNLLRKKK